MKQCFLHVCESRGSPGPQGPPGVGTTGPAGPAGATGPAGPGSLQTLWIEDPNDPIYNPFPVTDEDYFPYVIFDISSFSGHGDAYQYKMWHQGPTGTIALSLSNDGILWTLKGLTNLPVGGSYHACVLYDTNSFGIVGGPFYKVWYWTGSPTTTIGAIQYAESNDGFNWINIQSVTQGIPPLVDGVNPGFFYHLYGAGFVKYNPSATSTPGLPYSFPYTMLYDISSEGSGPGTNDECIGVAYSTDGKNWLRYGQTPVLIPPGTGVGIPPGPPSNQNLMYDWDGSHSFRPSIVIDDNRVYHMFYSGSNQNFTDGLAYAHGIGHAISRDGVTWSRDWENPIFYYNNGVAWRSGRTYTPFVLYGNFGSTGPKIWKMWFSGGNGSVAGVDQGIGYATKT
jgi:hypothetical protein